MPPSESNDPTLIIRNPATDEIVGTVPAQGPTEAKAAIAAAVVAQRDWRARSANGRCRPLRRMGELMLRDEERLARILTLEQGKPLSEARGEIRYAASFLEWAAEEGRRLNGETIPGNRRNQRILVFRQPIGVTAAITPWNFPSAMITRKLGPALATGCAMVVKPAEQTPLSALALRELADEAQIPADVFRIVTGEPEAIGDAFLSNPAVRMLSFTGSTEVGKLLMRKAAENVTRLGLELGGHAPFLVFDDADLEKAVSAAIACKFRNAGQTCISANRFLVQDGIYERFADALAARVSDLRVGSGLEEGVHIGPLIDDAAVAKVERHLDDALSGGATVRTGGQKLPMEEGFADRFFAPTVLDGITGQMQLSHEETFGPIAPLRRFVHEDEALEIANDTPYGLAAYFFTRDASRLMRMAEGLDYGIVGANDGGPSTAQAPFGGMKQSGIGREGGHHGMDEYVEIKYVSWQI